MNRLSGIVIMLFSLMNVSMGYAKQVIRIEPDSGDMTLVVRRALESANDKDIELVFEKGVYHFLPDYAYQRYCFITNHDNGIKNIIFPFEGYHSVEIKGNGAQLIFHGQEMPFLFEGCSQVTVTDLSIDWDIPFLFQGEVVAVNPEEGWRDIKPFDEGFAWEVEKGALKFPNIDGFVYSELGSTLPFEKNPKRVAYGAWDISSNPDLVEKRPGGVLRFHEKLKYYPPVGTILNSKGPKGENRYAPAMYVISSNNIHFQEVVIHHALGMGFLMERSQNITLSKCGIYVKEGSPRVVSVTADATHFCNCKGNILIENCRFEQMLDDGTNVHGTYVEVNKVLDDKTLRVEVKHFQQLGFRFAVPGDEVWFIHQPSPQRGGVNTVTEVSVINDRFTDLSFKDPIPSEISSGDVLENKTWNPVFTMRGCTIKNHRARNIVLKTPLKTVIEDNYFSSMMSAVLFRGETYYWFESGAVNDVLIRNNHFVYNAYSGSEHAVMYITPRLGKSFDQTEVFDRNIRFEDNLIETFDNRIVWADRVDGLSIRNNTIRQTHEVEPLHPDAPLFQLENSQNVSITNNSYQGDCSKAVVADKRSKKSLVIKKNKGF